MNLTPSLINSSGSCETSSATLSLTQEQTTILNFTFTLVRPSYLFFKFSYTIICFTVCFLLFKELHEQQVSPELSVSARSLDRCAWYVLGPKQHPFSLCSNGFTHPVIFRRSIRGQQLQSQLSAKYTWTLLHVQHRAKAGRDASILPQHIQTAGAALWGHR